ncbi:CLIP domain-containing serine protease B4-like isoform X2 [Toxorhynchites rutilus septentrionalis]|uniref:CLIP domain-containing serine protease B4-like isoform X2 n=1 Tax=Toxorhynchites rutilus septentrionalis TaxID=329112 RepID=UPI00247898CA|nr:CLIP domain-containing serine protease B4-like isoform X2 [Toxorhynchites rutilus septentrionalis]
MDRRGIFAGLVLVIISQSSDAHNHAIEGSICETEAGVGECVGVREYPLYLQTLRKRERSEEETQFLWSGLCGHTSERKALACRPVRLNEMECGRQFTFRIVKGKLADLEDYPWMALFQYKKPRGQTGFHCGGVLITKRYVLSAAHCFVGLRSGWEAIKVRLGEWDFESELDCTEEDGDQHCAPPVQEFDLERIMPHEGFSVRDKHKSCDIALVRLSREAEFTNYVKPICIPEPGSVNSGRLYDGIMFASGWGKTENASSSRYKLHTSLQAADYSTCRAAYANSLQIMLGDGQFCAGVNDGRDTCNGDSGGPLMREISEQGRFYVSGLVSFGPKRCGEQLPGVYTKVEHYYNWIHVADYYRS